MAYKLDGTRFKAWTDAGAPLVGGKLYTYSSGTTTPKATYTDSTLGSANTNPIILDARGEADVWLGSGAYTFLLQTSAGVTVDTVDGVVDPQAAAESAIRADLASTAAGKGSKLVAFIQRLTGAVARWAEDKLAESVSVEDFGGETAGSGGDDTAAFQQLVNVGGRIKLGRKKTYLIDLVTVTQQCDLDLNGSTIKRRTNGYGTILSITGGGGFRARNGTVDGQNFGSNFGHLIQFDDPTGVFEMDRLTVQNNCQGYGTGTPLASQDTDLVYVNRAAALKVRRSKFKAASRNGLAVVGAVQHIEVGGSNEFEDCYLFGLDVEPNAPTDYMYRVIRNVGNIYKNCGSKGGTNYVWNGGGPYAIHAGADLTKVIADSVECRGNRVISDDFLNVSGTLVEPYIVVDQYRSLDFGDKLGNLDRVILSPYCTGTVESTVLRGVIVSLVGNMSGSIFVTKSQKTTATGNQLSTLSVDSGEAEVTANGFQGGLTTYGLKLGASVTSMTAGLNVFKDKVTAIDNTAAPAALVAVGNKSTGHTTFIADTTQCNHFGNDTGSGTTDLVFRAVKAVAGLVAAGAVVNRVNYAAGRGVGYRCDVGLDSPVTATFAGAMFGAVNQGGSGSGNADAVIQTAAGQALATRVRVEASGHLRPEVDNSYNCGTASFRWSTVYAGTGAINTSDARAKQQVRSHTDAERAAALRVKGLIRAFRFNAAVDAKAGAARWHFGVIAQDVVEALRSEGLDPFSYGFVCHDEWDELPEELGDGGEVLQAHRPAGDRYGIRYDELAMFVLGAI